MSYRLKGSQRHEIAPLELRFQPAKGFTSSQKACLQEPRATITNIIPANLFLLLSSDPSQEKKDPANI